MASPRFEMIGRDHFQGRTHYLFILDKSGSMRDIEQPTRSGFNETLADIRAEDPEAPVTVVLFDTAVEALVAARPALEVPNLDENNYRPGGWTALYDAMGKAIQEAEPAVVPGDRALVCIITDGAENSSRRFNKDQAMALVHRLEGQGNWTFTYLSAAPDAFGDAQRAGVSLGNTRAFAATAAGSNEAWSVLRASRGMYTASVAPQSLSFYAERTTGDTEPEEAQPDPGSSTI